jgi:hypothetical protein
VGALREAAGPLTAREIARRLLAQAGREADEGTLRRAAGAVGKALRRQRANGAAVGEVGSDGWAVWRLVT